MISKKKKLFLRLLAEVGSGAGTLRKLEPEPKRIGFESAPLGLAQED
jgi:hypothetical protein